MTEPYNGDDAERVSAMRRDELLHRVEDLERLARQLRDGLELATIGAIALLVTLVTVRLLS